MAAVSVGASLSRDTWAYADLQRRGSCSLIKNSEPVREETDLKIAEVITFLAWCSHLGSCQTWNQATAAEGVFLASWTRVFLGSGALSLEAVKARTALLSASWRWLHLQTTAGLTDTCVPRAQHHVLSTPSRETNALTTPNQNMFCFSSTGRKERLGFPGGKFPTENTRVLFSFRLMNAVTLSPQVILVMPQDTN